jgi:hypothetical protein
MVVCESSEELAGALHDYTRLAPSVDILGINTYYTQHLKALPEVVAEFGRGKPYMVTEFGPDGYWHDDYSPRTAGGFLIEPSAKAKAKMYASRWESFVFANQGFNLGGVAYCWSERYEGSSSWFGLVARDGTPKPAYAALRQAWTGGDVVPNSGPTIERLIVSEHVVAPGEGITVQALVGREKVSQPVELNWEVLESDFGRCKVKLKPLSSGHDKLTITMPEDEGRYWIHLHVSDQSGNMDEIAEEVWVSKHPSGKSEVVDDQSNIISFKGN